jgi:hypothetical protein
LYLLVQKGEVAFALKLGMSLLPNVNMSLTLTNLIQFELQGTGVTFDNWDIKYMNWTYQAGLIMILVDFLLLCFFGYYFDQVIQTDYGIARPWNFLCTSEFWSGSKKAKVQDEERRVLIDDD